LLLALLAAVPAAARQVVTSPGPDAVSVTVYRDPYERDMELDWLRGYALITETRTISLPAGESVIRFEGVAGNIIPVSAIVRGLPREVAEKNHDARLLSAGALVDAALGRQVHIRRTNPATGRTTETEAIIRSGPDGIVLQTPDGVEALRCTGLPETLVYDEPPPGLSAKPTLAVSTSSAAPLTATVQLSYLASQFDWRAYYVANLAPDGRSLDLFAWLTLANANDESFVDASTQVVAGHANREEDEEGRGAEPVAPEISLHCWPAGTTSDVGQTTVGDSINDLPRAFADAPGEIIVTGTRIYRPNLTSTTPVTSITAELEGLGDLKLYRIPVPVTVAANAQKQVALLHRESVRFERLYAASVYADEREPDEEGEPKPAQILIRTKNVEERGLGKPLPSGRVAFFEQAGGRPMLVGETWIGDTPVGQDVELVIGESPDVAVVHRLLPAPNAKQDHEGDLDPPVRHELTITNATSRRAEVEVALPFNEEKYRLVDPSRKLGRKNGRSLWRARVPAHGKARLTYTIEERPPRDVDNEDD
jgi:hypothetical protein